MGWEWWPQCPRPDWSHAAIGSQLNSKPACGAGSGAASMVLGWSMHLKEKPCTLLEDLHDAFIPPRALGASDVGVAFSVRTRHVGEWC